MTVRFGEFTFSIDRQELLRNGERLGVTPKVMQLLELLIDRRGRVVTHAEIHDVVWPDVVVSDANVKNLISALRTALDDHERDGRFIRNVHSRGYVFTDQVRVETAKRPAAASARLFHAGESYPLAPGRNIIGRMHDCDVTFDHPSVSRHHAVISVIHDKATVEDLASRNGTFVNGVGIDGPCAISGRTVLSFGDVVAIFTPWDDGTTTETALRAPAVAQQD